MLFGKFPYNPALADKLMDYLKNEYGYQCRWGKVGDEIEFYIEGKWVEQDGKKATRPIYEEEVRISFKEALEACMKQ